MDTTRADGTRIVIQMNDHPEGGFFVSVHLEDPERKQVGDAKVTPRQQTTWQAFTMAIAVSLELMREQGW